MDRVVFSFPGISWPSVMPFVAEVLDLAESGDVAALVEFLVSLGVPRDEIVVTVEPLDVSP